MTPGLICKYYTTLKIVWDKRPSLLLKDYKVSFVASIFFKYGATTFSITTLSMTGLFATLRKKTLSK
jgi:hypothetical protein